VTPVTHQEVRKVEPVVHQERARAEATQSEASIMREMESVNRSAETRLVTASAVSAPVTESVVTQSQQAVADASPVVTHEVVERADFPVTEQTAISETAVTTLPAQVHESGPAPVETAAVQQKPLTESSLSQPAIESVPVETAAVQTPAIESSVAQQTPRTPIQHASIQNPAVQSMPATKADYSWLLEALWSRVEQLKRYPYLARTNRWEGLVVLRAVINQDGQLLDLKVAESSGHAVLDQDAMDVMRRSCPLHLKHPLGKPQVELRVPISYKLR
jgi:protein TonB